MTLKIAKKCLEATRDNSHHLGELTYQADTEKNKE
jgi:hypothetical protein